MMEMYYTRDEARRAAQEFAAKTEELARIAKSAQEVAE